MKRFILILFIGISSLHAWAQNEEKTVSLSEVTVKGAKVVSKVDGLTLFPTEAQKNSSNNGYSILQKLGLANIRVDNIAHTVSAIDNRGSVQLRINSIIVGLAEMLALDPKLISKIDFVDNPGLRYGEDVAYVINIITKRDDTGYTIGTDITPTLTSLQGNGMAYGKWNHRKSEFSVSYNYGGYKLKGSENHQTANYTLNDGTIYTIERNDVESLRKSNLHDVKLTYNLADTTAYVFQASLSESIGNSPDNYSIQSITDGAQKYLSKSTDSNRFHSPVLDLYFFRQITPRQSITANAVGTYIATKANNGFNEGMPYEYDVDGKTASVLSEVKYENRLKPFTLSAGLDNKFKHAKNDYCGDASALTNTTQNNTYAFCEIKGALRAFRYSAGAGESYIHYNQDKHNYNLWTFRSKAMLSYDFTTGLQLRYSFSTQERASRVAMTSNATILTNSMERTVGNPDLKPSRDTEHSLRLSYNTSRFDTFIDCFFRHCHKPNMALYERTEDNKFIYTQINQKEIDVLNNSLYAGYWVVPEKLQVRASGGLMRCFNFGNAYTHCYTSWFCQGDVIAYLGKFTLRAYADNGSRFLEGETKGYSGAYTALQASFIHKDLQLSLTWANPLVNKHKEYEGELINTNLHKVTSNYNLDNGNNITLNFSWRMSHGKKHRSADKTINLKDTENGIIHAQ